MDPVIRAQIEEVRDAAGIEMYSVHLKVEDENLWDRIQARLAREPSREQLNEGVRAHMDKIHDRCKSFKWDFVVDNTSEGGGEIVMNEILENVRGVSKRFRTLSEVSEESGKGGACGSPTTVTAAFSLE